MADEIDPKIDPGVDPFTNAGPDVVRLDPTAHLSEEQKTWRKARLVHFDGPITYKGPCKPAPPPGYQRKPHRPTAAPETAPPSPPAAEPGGPE